jgi:hypothetical protein
VQYQQQAAQFQNGAYKGDPVLTYVMRSRYDMVCTVRSDIMGVPSLKPIRAMEVVNHADVDIADDLPEPGTGLREPMDKQLRESPRRVRAITRVSTDLEDSEQMGWVDEVPPDTPASEMSIRERDQKQLLTRTLSGLGLFRHDCDCNKCAPISTTNGCLSVHACTSLRISQSVKLP